MQSPPEHMRLGMRPRCHADARRRPRRRRPAVGRPQQEPQAATGLSAQLQAAEDALVDLVDAAKCHSHARAAQRLLPRPQDGGRRVGTDDYRSIQGDPEPRRRHRIEFSTSVDDDEDAPRSKNVSGNNQRHTRCSTSFAIASPFGQRPPPQSSIHKKLVERGAPRGYHDRLSDSGMRTLHDPADAVAQIVDQVRANARIHSRLLLTFSPIIYLNSLDGKSEWMTEWQRAFPIPHLHPRAIEVKPSDEA